MNYQNGEHMIEVNRIKHWVKVAMKNEDDIPVIIIHGGPGGNNYVFENTIGKELEKNYSIIYYEQRGCGRSMHPLDSNDYLESTLLFDLALLIVKLGIKKIIPWGYSYGGELALKFAIKYPHLVDKVIAQAPSHFSDLNRMGEIQYNGFLEVATEGEKNSLMLMKKNMTSFAEVFDQVWNLTSSETQDKFLFHDSLNAARMHELWNEAGLANTGLMFDALKKDYNQIDLLQKVHTIPCPVLIIVGQYDRNCGYELCREITDEIPSATLSILKDAAHFPDFEQQDKCLDIVQSFLK